MHFALASQKRARLDQHLADTLSLLISLAVS